MSINKSTYKPLTFDDWVNKRSDLNHSWLMNIVMSLFEEKNDCAHFDFNDFDKKVALKWRKKMGTADRLLQSMESTFSPSNFFKERPLSNLPPEDREKLSDFHHKKWLSLMRIHEKRDNVSIAIVAAKEAFDRIKNNRKNGSLSNSDLDKFHNCCQTLSASISALPHSRDDYIRALVQETLKQNPL